MRRRNWVVAALGLAILVTGGIVLASNMGFKLNYQLSGPPQTGTNTLALPYNQMVGLVNAKNLIDDINSTGSPTNKVVNVQRWSPATDGLTVYAGAPTDGAAFSLAAAEAYYVKVSANTNYVVVGSDDPAKVVTFVGPPQTGTNFFSVPYHTTSANAKNLIDDINTNGSPASKVVNVQKWNKLADALIVYAGAPTDGAAFTFVPGEGVFVKVSQTVNYTPSHF
jgi:hypothetical protein